MVGSIAKYLLKIEFIKKSLYKANYPLSGGDKYIVCSEQYERDLDCKDNCG